MERSRGSFLKPDTKVSGFFVDYFGEKFIPNLFWEAQEREQEVSRKTGASKTCISKCCWGERENNGEFLWKYS